MGTDKARTSEALQPNDLRGLFLLLGLGLVVGLLVALLELLSRARNQAKDGKVGKSITWHDHIMTWFLAMPAWLYCCQCQSVCWSITLVQTVITIT